MRISLRTKEAFDFYGFISPCLLGLLLFTVGPIIASFLISFTDWDVLSAPKWVGFANYIEIFMDDELFFKSLWNTIYYSLFSVPLGLVIGYSLALLLNQKVKGMAVYRTIFFLPSIVPAVASSILWMWIFHPDMGLLNTFLTMTHVTSTPPQWLFSTAWSKPAMIIMSLWGVGGGMVIYLAGLQGIPEYYYEAAEIDGANSWQKFWNVTLPLTSPVIFFNLIMGVIGAFQIFTQAFIMTAGGPADSTLFYSYYIYRKAFQEFQMGYASALAWILFVVILILTLLQFKYIGKKVHYE